MEESVLFENLISSSYRSQDIKVISPAMEQHYSANGTLVFKINQPTPSPFTIKIYTNKGNKLHEIEDIATDTYMFEKKLSQGLYYWKLEEDDDLLFVGKFFVLQ